ncbi:shikimate dehydrogenase [Salidesulfovibrio onnuriiensis]|uniref:shikimate dehydrogenase n=1 Tax=Salidesulfovibrio onnuriiensis TaxID=2583823 RepID=UPI0011CC1C94|nr:shikimate dehydrogenase [Salidesulfovibrio onnuriiensis]
MTQRYGIIGWPLGHTLSPTLHNSGFKTLGIDAEYVAWPLEPLGLSDFMARFRDEEIQGLSVTIPHKRSVMKYLDEMTFRAKSVGAVNTVFWKDDLVWGENTDVNGLIDPLAKMRNVPKTALVLGAGGAARAAVVGLQELEVGEIIVCNRTRSKAEILGHDFNVRVVDWEKRHELAPGLILNTTPLGMSGELETLSPWEADFPRGCVVYDIVYNPLRTRLLAEAREKGCEIIEGIEMFLHQGLAQFRLWTGREYDAQAARRVLLEALS